jgi:hypothetical protein
MSTTLRETIMQEAETVLSALEGVAVYQDIFDALDASIEKALVFGWTADTGKRSGRIDDHTLEVILEGFATGRTARTIADGVLADALDLLMASNNLGSKVKSITLGSASKMGAPEGARGVVIRQVLILAYVSKSESLIVAA